MTPYIIKRVDIRVITNSGPYFFVKAIIFMFMLVVIFNMIANHNRMSNARSPTTLDSYVVGWVNYKT